MRHIVLLLGICAASASGPVFAGGEEWIEPHTGMPFVAVEKGCFRMGSTEPVLPPANTMWAEIDYRGTLSDNEKPAHEACVDAFWLAKFEVRRKDWRAVMGASTGKAAVEIGGDDFPVSHITWEQAQAFARRLSEISATSERFRLPTEAEWEYACRAGQDAEQMRNPVALAQSARFGLGDWKSEQGPPTVGTVGELQPNAFGVHDMLGNVWEWVEDQYAADAYSSHALFNPVARANTDQRGIRGGSFRTELEQTRCTRRGHQDAGGALDTIGFRLVRER